LHYRDKKVTVFGLGKSGIAAAEKLLELGARVTISEKRKREECDEALIDGLKSRGAIFEFGGHTLNSISGAELIVVSPGIHLDISVLDEAKRRGQLVISEVELACRFLRKPIIAITGTNGKTTTATLIHEFLKAGGKRAALAGNIGHPLILVNDRNLDYVVVEISSYQLEGIYSFRPWISLFLNLTPDHIERHKNMEAYAEAKARIFLNQGKTDFVIYNPEDPLVLKMVSRAAAKKIPFMLKEIFFDPGSIKLKGRHNLENIMAASLAAELCGVNKEAIKRTIENFPGVPHRIEFVRKINGVDFYNDSKGTNPDSTIKAIEALERNIVLILGGLDKGVTLSEMINEIKKSVTRVVLIGEAAVRFNRELIAAGYKNISFAGSMEEAVAMAFNGAKSGDQVLLSPACASFDMFSNFEERGEVFKSCCAKL